MPSVQNSFFARALNGIEKIIAESPYNILVCINNELFKKEVNNIKILANGVVNGFIVAVAEETQ